MDNFNKTDDLYDPNFSIDAHNTDKLDMYGVWLKQKKDIIETPDDLSLVPDGDLPGGASQHDIHFDDDFSFSETFPELDGKDDALSIDEFSTARQEEAGEQISADDEEETGFSEDTFESLDLDDFLDNSEAPATEDTDSFIDAEPIEIDFAASSHIEPLENRETPPAGLENFSEISLEDFEDNVTETPTETNEKLETLETIEDFDTIFEESEAPAVTKRKDITSFDLDITVDDDAQKIKHIEEISAETAAETSDISIFDSDDTNMGAKASPFEAEEEPFFDDVEAVEQDLLETQPDTEPDPATAQAAADTDTSATSSPQSSAAQDRATELLMQIAHEISDLKAELNSLKAGLAVQSHSSTEAPEKTVVPQQENTAEDSAGSGFFSDDDTDETIALTGDELNNILITADFTEEKNIDEEETADEYEIPEVLTRDIVPDIPETPEPDTNFEASITEVSELNQRPDAESSSTVQQTEGEKLLASEPVFNVEPAPITSLPDDLSYLDGESETIDSEIEIIDGVSMESPQQEEELEDEDIDTLEAAQDFEDIAASAFDLPMEQEIQIPQEDTADTTTPSPVHSTIALSETHTIHELQKDEDFANPFEEPVQLSELGAEDEIIEEDFIEEISVPESKTDEVVSAEPVEELSELSEPELDEAEKAEGNKQETLLQAATQIINGERGKTVSIPLELKNEIKSVLAYMDQLLEALPEKKIEEFAKSDYFETYKHLFEELGIS